MGAITAAEYLIALKKAATWGTAVQCGQNDGLLILSEGLKGAIAAHPDDSAGLSWLEREDKGLYDPVKGNLEAYLRYEGLDVVLALAMGTAGTPQQQGGTSAYKHTLQLADNLDGLFCTIAQLKQTDKVWEIPSAKIHGFTIAGDIGTPLKITIPVLGTKLVFNSSTNTPSTMDNVTYPDKKNRVIFDPTTTVIRMNDQDGAALGDSDKIYPNSIEIAFDRKMDADYTQNDYIDEPVQSDFPTITVTLKFPRYDAVNHQYFLDWDAFTAKKMDILFKGAQIESDYYYQMKFLFPKLRVDDPEAAMGGKGKIPASIKLVAYKADSAPSGMTGITLPFQLEIINKNNSNPLG